MNCLKCKYPSLQKRIEAGVEIDQCPSCRGNWLDMLELERLLEIDARSLVEDDKRFGTSAIASEARINCPKCRGTYMIKINSLVKTGTILDSCMVCFSTWLDADEYSRLASKGLRTLIRAMFASHGPCSKTIADDRKCSHLSSRFRRLVLSSSVLRLSARLPPMVASG